MRRIIRLWHRRQRAITTAPATPRVEDATAQPAPMPEPTPAPPVVDWSGYDINAAVDAIVANHIPALPRRVQQVVRETAREIRSDLTGPIFAADGLPLMDDPFIADFTWNVSAFEVLTTAKRTLPTRQQLALYQLEHAPRRGMLTFTVYAPPLWCEDEHVIRSVERELRRQINESVCFAIWARVTFTWRKSNDPAWAVSIAAVDAPMEGAA